MVIDIHKAIISNPISKNLLKPWASNANPNSLRSKLFNKYTDPGNPIEKQVDIHPYTGQIYKIHDPPLSNNDRCSMLHDIAYTVADNIEQNPKDVKNRKLEADKEWLDCFKVGTPYDMLAYTAIKSKITLGLVLHPYNSFFTVFLPCIFLYCAHKLLQTLQIASNFAAYFCIFKLISSITSSLADDDYKIVIESFQHKIIVVFHSCSL